MLKLTSKAERKLRSRWVSPAEESAGGKVPEARRGLPRGPQEAPQDEEGRGSRRPLEPGEQGDRRGDDIILPHDAPGPVGGAGESCPPLPHRCLPGRDTPATLRSPRRSRAREGGPTSGDALTLKQAAARHPRDLGDGNIPGVYSGRAPFAWTLPRPRTPGRKAKERRRPGSPAQPGGAALGERGSRPPGGRDKAGDGGSA
ncbi:unnamed protein product [Rangifer tarandus platyrhynchus]|uniref:Uncharacterized protein n=1 Tax=Rangifer tarandus platyrhynchus TaxID=3082113 RepID=A0ABN8ZHQ2_RANTA|nr:unnamed protein product [Rangifer tarandus platyrhynchus]